MIRERPRARPRPKRARTLRWTVLALAFVAALLAGAGDASACPVCYGQAEGKVIDGAKLSVFFMGGLVYTVMGGGVALAFVAARRARRDLEEGEDADRHHLQIVRDRPEREE